jgi:ABC-type uncharacterized transport system substrate-binding protein
LIAPGAASKEPQHAQGKPDAKATGEMKSDSKSTASDSAAPKSPTAETKSAPDSKTKATDSSTNSKDLKAPTAAEAKPAADSKTKAPDSTAEGEIETAFTEIIQLKANALIVATDALLLGQRTQIVRLSARHSVPTVYFSRDFVDAGGLLSYGPNISNGYRQAGNYTGQILSGANPAKLPVLRPTQFTLVVNLKTAGALGLTVPPMLLALADEVIE